MASDLTTSTTPTPGGLTGSPTTRAAESARSRGNFWQVVGILPVLLLIGVLFSLLTPNFLTSSNLINVARQASINTVLAAGMTFVILTGGIDLSVGSILGVSAVVALQISLLPSLVWAVLPLTLLSGLLLGTLTGATVAYVGLPPFIVTLGTYTALRGVAYLLANGTTIINNDLSFEWIGNGRLGPIPWLIIIALATILVSGFILRRTVLGVRIYAVGGNAQAARLTGIRVERVLVFVYAVSGLLAALAGLMSASRLYSANGKLGEGYELDAIAAVILGGTSFTGGIGTISGTLLGALVIATLNNGLTLMNVSFFWQLVVKGLVIVVAVTVDKLRTRAAA